MKTVVAILLAVMCQAQSNAPARALNVEYDGLRNLTSFETEGTLLRGAPEPEVSLSFFYPCVGKTTKCRPQYIAMHFTARVTTTEDGWQYLERHDVVILAGGKRIVPASRPKWSGQMSRSDYSLEFVYALFDPRDFLTACAADSVEVMVGAEHFTVKPQYLDEWRLLAKSFNR